MKKRILCMILVAAILIGISPVEAIIESAGSFVRESSVVSDIRSDSGSNIVQNTTQYTKPSYNSSNYPLYERYDMPIYTTDLFKAYKAEYITDAAITKTSPSITAGPKFTAEEPEPGSGIRYPATYPVDWRKLNLTTASSTFGNDEIVWRGSLSAPDPTTKVVLGARRMDSNSYISMTDWYGDEVFVKMTSPGETTFNLSDLEGWSVVRTKGGIYTPYIVLIDDRMPIILGYDISSDGRYFDIYFDEPIRVANSEETKLSDFTVTVTYVNSRSGVKAGELTYKGSSVKNGYYNTNKLTLYCDNVPSGEYTITEIVATGTPGNQNFEVMGMVQCNYYYIYSQGGESVFDYTGHPVVAIDERGGWAPLTDLAGNAAVLPGKTDVKDQNLSWDTRAPQVEQISATGSMSSVLNEVEKKETEDWPDDIDRSAVYAGTGDQMYFNVKFDESMQSFGTVTLNVDMDGRPVTLSNPSVTSYENSNGDKGVVASYGPVVFDSRYSMTSGYEYDNIKIISFGGSFVDQNGNYLDNSAAVKNMAQKIYLDVDAPTISTAQLVTGNNTTKFTIKVEMSDEKSGFLGLSGELGISVKRIQNSVKYTMAITETINEPLEEEYKYKGELGNNTVSYHTIPLYVGERYIHVKLDETASVSIEDIKVEYKIPDWAGNVNSSEATETTPGYYYDNIPPTLTIPTIYVDYLESSAKVTASWATTDFHSSLGVTTYYQWSNTKPANYSDGWLTTTDYEATQTSERGFWMTNVNEAPRVETNADTPITLWVYAKDASGNVSEMLSASTTVTLSKPTVVFNYSMDLSMPQSNPLWEIGVGSNPSAAAVYTNGYVRVFINFDTEGVANTNSAYESTHVLIYSSEIFANYANGTANLFDLLKMDANGEIDRVIPYYTVYLSEDGETFDSVSSIKHSGDLYDLVNSWYGNITVSYDAIFSNTSLPIRGGDEASYQSFLTSFEFIPRRGSTLSGSIVNASYINEGDPITFAYSGNVDNIYTIDFGIPKKADGNELTEQEGYVSGSYERYYTELFYRTLAGVSIDFNVTNSLIGKWGVYDLDMSNSYLSVIKLGKNGGEDEAWVNIPVSCENPLNDVSPHTILFNRVNLPDMEYETGTYVLELVLTNYAGATTVKRLEDTYLVVDNEKAPQIGVWNTYITPGISLYSGLPRVVRYDENGNPVLEITEYNSKAIYDTSPYVINNDRIPGTDQAILGMSVSLAGRNEISRNEIYVSEGSGAENFGFTVSVLENEYIERLQTIGAVREFYIWNPAVHASREEGIKVSGELYYKFVSGNASDHSTWTYDADNGNIGSSVLNTNDQGVFDLASVLGIKAGENRICMQVVMENGNQSSIEQFAISVTASTPEASLRVFPRVSLNENETNNISWADINLSGMFSDSNIHGSYVLSKNKVVLVETKEVLDEGSGIYRTVEELTEYERYSYKDTLKALEDGYYNGILGIRGDSFGYYNSGLNQFLDKNGNQIDPEYHISSWGMTNYYQMIPVDADDTVRLMGDDYFNYGLYTSGTGTVTYKSGEFDASAGMLVIDESGATIFLLPQFENQDAYSEADFVEGYTPKYTLTNKVLRFYDSVSGVTLNPTYAYNGRLEFGASVWNLENADLRNSYIEFSDVDGNVIATFSLGEDVGLPNNVGYGGIASYGGNSITFEVYAPVADGVNHQPGEKYDVLWAQVRFYDSNTGEYLVTDRVNLVPRNGGSFNYADINPSVVDPREYVNEIGTQNLSWQTNVMIEGKEDYGFMRLYTIKNSQNHSGEVTFTDVIGNKYTANYTTSYYDFMSWPYVDISHLDTTMEAVVVTITPNETWTDDDYDPISVRPKYASGGLTWTRDEETGVVTAIITQNMTLQIDWGWAYDDPVREERLEEIAINNIITPELAIEWSYGENTEDYAHGNVTAYVVDKNNGWRIIDPITGDNAQYTFEYGSDVTQYTWNTVGIMYPEEAPQYVHIGEITAYLEVELNALPEILLPREEYDKRQPSVQVIPFTMQGTNAVPLNMKYVFEDNEERFTDTEIDFLNPSLGYYDYTLYTDADEFSRDLGWGNIFKFKVEVGDVNMTKTVIKAGYNASAPTNYATAVSDEINGAWLMGSMITVTNNTEFTIFVIDRENNVTAVPIRVSEIIDAPTPQYTKELYIDYDGKELVSVDLIAPENVSRVYITRVDGEEAYYAEFTKNGVYTIDYEYEYYGCLVKGQIEVEITEIDESKAIPPQLRSITWSANSSGVTNQDVIATLIFDKNIENVYMDENVDIEVLIVGNRATVKYKNNARAVNLFFTSTYGLQSDAIRMPEINNIDRDPPIITVGDIKLSEDGRYALVSFESNERVSFREAGKINTVFEKKYSENGIYDCTFTDMAGNIHKLQVTIDCIVKTKPTMLFSLSENGSGSVASPDDLGNVKMGDLFYISVDRDCVVSFNGESKEVLAGAWTEFTVGDSSGGSIKARDAYGNTASAVFTNIEYPDITPPTINIKNHTVYGSILDLDKLDEAIKANATAIDDRDREVPVTVEYAVPTDTGDYAVTYIAKDNSGNIATVVGKIRVYPTTAPIVAIDGNLVERESIYIAQSDDILKLTVDMQGEPYEVVYKKGIKTVAQMKIGSCELDLVDGEIILPFAGEEGYYTICITTQNHDSYRITVYVK